MMKRTAAVLVVAGFMACLPCIDLVAGCADQIRILPEGPTNAVDLEGDLAAIGNGRLLKIVDLSDPASPVVLGSLTMPGLIRAVDLHGNLALVAADVGGLQIVDISQPSDPVLTWRWTRELVQAVDVIGRNDIALVLTQSYDADSMRICALHILDISDPRTPMVLGSYGNRGEASAIAVGAGRFVYMARRGSRVRVIDIADPANPNGVAEVRTPYTTEQSMIDTTRRAQSTRSGCTPSSRSIEVRPKRAIIGAGRCYR